VAQHSQSKQYGSKLCCLATQLVLRVAPKHCARLKQADCTCDKPLTCASLSTTARQPQRYCTPHTHMLAAPAQYCAHHRFRLWRPLEKAKLVRRKVSKERNSFPFLSCAFHPCRSFDLDCTRTAHTLKLVYQLSSIYLIPGRAEWEAVWLIHARHHQLYCSDRELHCELGGRRACKPIFTSRSTYKWAYVQHSAGTYAAQQKKQQQRKQQHVGMLLVKLIIPNALPADKRMFSCSLSLVRAACAR
jgi:hypothetical protein